MAVLTHPNSREGELWDLEYAQPWKTSRYPLEICSWKSPAHRRKAESSSRALSSSSLAHWEQAWLPRFSCTHVLSDSTPSSSSPHMGFPQKEAEESDPKQRPWWSLHGFSFHGDQDFQDSTLLRGAGRFFWEHGSSQASPGSRTGGTSHRHSAKLVFKQRQRAGLFSWSPGFTFTLDPPQQHCPLFSQLLFPSDGSTNLELTFQSPTWK